LHIEIRLQSKTINKDPEDALSETWNSVLLQKMYKMRKGHLTPANEMKSEQYKRHSMK
jgi:hypothetical protein